MSMPPAIGSQVRLSGAQAEEWIITGTIPALAPAGTIVAANIQRQATSAALPQQIAPGREVWHIERIYYVGANPVPDCWLILLVDLVPQPYTVLASSVNLAQNRPAALARTMIVTSGSVVSAQIVNLPANAATVGVIVTFKVQVMRASP